jgi:hypothetical protein
VDSECGLAHLHTQNKFQNYKYPSNRIAPWHYHLSYIYHRVAVGRKKVFVGTFFCTLPNRKIPSSFYQTNSFLYKFIYKNQNQNQNIEMMAAPISASGSRWPLIGRERRAPERATLNYRSEQHENN